ncbi:hypothetical protein SAMN05216276_11053 [Streptosporangium subroseum]|uniref:Uncharacterized protein n=1 Tax=Streptosporangium subroseum TaxID=106412 RepID=A0A239PBL8_9ACTN|nr:hypothetical protein SAMN05216276_11053 [Streptosporangium subroseum]
MLASGNFMVGMYLFVRSCGHRLAIPRRCERRQRALRPAAALVRDRPFPAPPLVKSSRRRRRVRFERGVTGRRSPSASRQPRSNTARSGEATMWRTSLAAGPAPDEDRGVTPGETRRRRRSAQGWWRGVRDALYDGVIKVDPPAAAGREPSPRDRRGRPRGEGSMTQSSSAKRRQMCTRANCSRIDRSSRKFACRKAITGRSPGRRSPMARSGSPASVEEFA